MSNLAVSRPPEEAAPGGSGPTQAAPLSPDEALKLYRWSLRFTGALVALRRQYDGDLDAYLLHSVFVQAELQQAVRAQGGGRGMNALSLADITAIPRETARRKLKRLADRGLLRQGIDGLHYLSGHEPPRRFVEDLGRLFAPQETPPASVGERRSWRFRP